MNWGCAGLPQSIGNVLHQIRLNTSGQNLDDILLGLWAYPFKRNQDIMNFMEAYKIKEFISYAGTLPLMERIEALLKD